VVVATTAAIRLRWPLLVGVVAVLAAVPPLVTVALEMIPRRRG
jgi:hypothetical protein